ncbi:MAG TPA: hypothetical protein PK354_02075 [bacterium]|nr:hypothetical protein [bacterium]
MGSSIIFSLFKIPISVFPLFKIPPTIFPLYKISLLISPFSKGGLRGISRNLPQLLFYKEGSDFSPFIKGRRKRDFIKFIPDFFCKGRRPEVGGGFEMYCPPLSYHSILPYFPFPLMGSSIEEKRKQEELERKQKEAEIEAVLYQLRKNELFSKIVPRLKMFLDYIKSPPMNFFLYLPADRFAKGFFFEWGTDEKIMEAAKKEIEYHGGKWIQGNLYFSKEGPIYVYFSYEERKLEAVQIAMWNQEPFSFSSTWARVIIEGTFNKLFGPSEEEKNIVNPVINQNFSSQNEKEYYKAQLLSQINYRTWINGQTTILIVTDRDQLFMEFKKKK